VAYRRVIEVCVDTRRDRRRTLVVQLLALVMYVLLLFCVVILCDTQT
jgi:hypothetical protein